MECKQLSPKLIPLEVKIVAAFLRWVVNMIVERSFQWDNGILVK
jgi:hypothetical protein